jgi:hypothetical protein
MKHYEEFENILCLRSKPLSLGVELQGVFIDLKDFQRLLSLLGEENEN